MRQPRSVGKPREHLVEPIASPLHVRPGPLEVEVLAVRTAKQVRHQSHEKFPGPVSRPMIVPSAGLAASGW